MHTVVCLALFAISVIGGFSWAPIGKAGIDNLDDLYQDIPLADRVYVLDMHQYTRDELAVLIFLQGITSKTAAAIYIDDSNPTIDVSKKYIEEYQARYVDTGKSATVFDYSVTNLWALVEKFSDSFGRKFVTFGTVTDGDPSINLAATIAGIDCVLGVPASLRQDAIAHGYTEVRDVRNVGGKGGYNSFIAGQNKIFQEYKNRLNKKLIVHHRPGDFGPRDLGITNGCFQFYTRDSVNSPKTYRQERAFRHEVYQWSEPNALLMGMWAPGDEIVYFADMSKFAKQFSPMEFRLNGTLLMALKGKERVEQRWRTDDDVPKATAVNGKHTICLYVTDGDNMGVGDINGGVCQPYTKILRPRMESGDTFKLTYSMAPLWGKLSPFSIEYLYNNNDGYGIGKYDSYVGCTSGLSIINASSYPRNSLKGFAKMTAQAMGRMDIRVMTPIDQWAHNPMYKLRATDYWSEFAKHDEIAGGLWQVDYPKYYAGYGCVVWANNKPWVAVRSSLWDPDDDSSEAVSPAWLTEMAQSVNQRCTDPKKIDGYSVIAVQPWSMRYSDVQYFVSKLDLNKVQIVFADELIDMVTKNVPHRDATPKREKAN